MARVGVGQDDINRQLDRLEAVEPIRVADVNLDVRDPIELARRLGSTFAYFGRVEGEVARNTEELRILLPHAGEATRRFYPVWQAQELPHGLVFEALQKRIGLDPDPPDLKNISLAIRLGGLLDRVPGLHPPLLLTYLSTGAMHEQLTATGYRLLADRLEEMGENGLVETAIKPILAQEAGHLRYYRMAARHESDKLAPWQVAVARLLKIKQYAPVGAGPQDRNRAFGQAAQPLLEGENLDALANPVQVIAEELLGYGDQGLPLPKFVAASLRDCLELAREQNQTPQLN